MRVGLVIALGLSEASRGNGLGVGFADAVTERVGKSIDAAAMRHNLEASGDVEACMLPRVFPTDDAAIRWAVEKAGPRVLRLESTANLGRLCTNVDVPDPYRREGMAEWAFDANGRLDPLPTS